ncbi:MAG: Holliday junction DNA helicase RuvA [Candidatus Omnitrophica bacterium]|nr:Holliday junction DNA helicase RuvA [Candidatus Omnitrophota bacterium]
MIVKIAGKLVEKKDQSLVVDVKGLFYEVVVPTSVLQRIDETKDGDGNVHLMTYHYFQIGPSSGLPMLIGFINAVEREFFQQFIKVSGIGPRAAVRALDKPICEIAHAINEGDINYLKTLPGIGMQRAKEIVAKLQGKVGRFALIQDKRVVHEERSATPLWQEEAMDVLLQLQYKKQEARDMIQKALKRSTDIHTTEDLLNEIYKQRIKG